MVAENPTWGAPRIHGELLKLGFDLSEPTVSRWVTRPLSVSTSTVKKSVPQAKIGQGTHDAIIAPWSSW